MESTAGGDNGGHYRILAVTACPTGIAHTYMAAEALEKKAAEMGYTIKVETNGSGGAKNVLTPEEIDAADGIIIAADKCWKWCDLMASRYTRRVYRRG